MDELFDPDTFELHYPLWSLFHPEAKALGFLRLTVPGGEAAPLFTDDDMARRFQAVGGAALSHYALGLIGSAAELLQLLGAWERKGITHVAIDPGPGRFPCVTVAELRAAVGKADSGSPPQDQPPAAG